jgi:hypothetical protein
MIRCHLCVYSWTGCHSKQMCLMESTGSMKSNYTPGGTWSCHATGSVQLWNAITELDGDHFISDWWGTLWRKCPHGSTFNFLTGSVNGSRFATESRYIKVSVKNKSLLWLGKFSEKSRYFSSFLREIALFWQTFAKYFSCTFRIRSKFHRIRNKSHQFW